MKTLALASFVCLASIALQSVASPACADFGEDPSTAVTNDTQSPISFQMQWGNGAPHSFTLQPGERQSFEIETVLVIRFESGRGLKGYRLESGVGYAFRYSDTGNLILVDDEMFTN
jgi:hypothetical protein